MTNTRNALIAAALTTALATTVGAAAIASSADFNPKSAPTPTVTKTTTVDVPRNFPVPGPTVTETRRVEVPVSRAKKRSAPRTAAPTGSVKGYARSLVGDAQWGCFDFIISHESGWRVTAENPSSGAYGLAQALPPTKYAAYGSDWRTNHVPQLKFAVTYMKQRYGSPCGAKAFWERNRWY